MSPAANPDGKFMPLSALANPAFLSALALRRDNYREALAGAILEAENDLDGLLRQGAETELAREIREAEGGLGVLLKLAAKEGLAILHEQNSGSAAD